jgi:carbon-monoxide dehydrogenase medium subunit
VTTLPPFSVHRAATVEEASALLAELGDDGVVYCGGTELLLVYRFGFADYPDLVDVKAIEELHGITVDGDELRIGAATTHREIERSALVGEHIPALAAMERHVGNVRVRNQGTIGGNLCFADPHSDPATFLLAANGSVSIRRGGEPVRRLPVEAFVRGPYETALEPGELLVAVHVPRPGSGTAIVHRKMSFRERPAITVAARVTVTGGRVSEARLAVGSVGVAPVLVGAAGAHLAGLSASDPDPSALLAAATAAAEAAMPVADENGSPEYKQQLVRVLSTRTVREAVEQARAA